MQEPLKRPLGPAANIDDPSRELSEAELLALEAVYCSHGDTVHYTNPPKIFETCEGSFLYDTEGRPYLDLQMWYSAVNFGYRNERLNEAVRRQLDRLPQVASQYLHREKIELAAMLAMFTMRPPPRIIAGAAAWITSSIDLTFTANMSSHSEMGMSRSGVWANTPALFTTTSRPPSADTASATVLATASGSRRSTAYGRAASPSPRARSSTPGPSRSSSATREPEATKWAAMPAPIPRAAPVTRTRRATEMPSIVVPLLVRAS